MSPTTILETAPLGALIRYTDSTTKPPARFTKKLAAWERSNGVGRLVKKEPPRPYPTWTAPASFTLHEGNFSSDGVILVTIMRTHSADSALTFEVAEEPQPGQVRVLLDFGGCTELLHLAESVTAAELWIAKEGYRNARLEIVVSEDGTVATKTSDAELPSIVGTISLFRFPNPAGLKAQGSNFFSETASSGVAQQVTAGDSGTGVLRQFYRERSNVQVVDELVSLILAQRNYEVNSRAVRVSDEMLQQVNQMIR